MNGAKILKFISTLKPCTRDAQCPCRRNMVQNLLFIHIDKTDKNRKWQELKKLDGRYRLCYGWQMQGKRPYMGAK